VKPRDFKSLVSTNFTTRAYNSVHTSLVGRPAYVFASSLILTLNFYNQESAPKEYRSNIFQKYLWRLRPESNRRTRLCRPLHNHSATQPQNRFLKSNSLKKGGGELPSPPPLIQNRLIFYQASTIKFWSGKRDSNSRPQPWQGCALPLSYSRRRGVIVTARY
jgi:hypothetical protein